MLKASSCELASIQYMVLLLLKYFLEKTKLCSVLIFLSGNEYNVTDTYICFILIDNYVILNAVEELITYFMWCFGYNLIV